MTKMHPAKDEIDLSLTSRAPAAKYH